MFGGTARRANAGRPLTRSLDATEEGLAMQATRAILSTLTVTALAVTLTAGPAQAHATCNTHTHWLTATRYEVTSTTSAYCAGIIWRLGWGGWRYAGQFTIGK